MKRAIVLIVFLGLISGCATYYPVRVNDYLDMSQGVSSIPFGSSFCLLEDHTHSGKNPILQAEVNNKIMALLREKGYRIETNEKADYFLRFTYAISPGRSESEIRPEFVPGTTETVQTIRPSGKISTAIVTTPGYTTYVPRRVTVYTSTLILEVLNAYSLRSDNKEKILWIGENSSASQNPDLRDTINYLLVAGFQNFGKNMTKSRMITIYEYDRRIKRVREAIQNQ